MKLIVGLGNPGTEYENTRHNAGFMVLDELARRHAGAAVARGRFHAATLDCMIGNEKVLFAKPTTFMNRSGLTVGEAIRFYKLQPAQDMLVVVDDIYLPLGALRLKPKGGDGGHNGLADIAKALGTDAYPRLRFGVDSQPKGASQVGYVLGRFTQEQAEMLKPALKKAADAVECWAKNGLSEAMNTFNTPEDKKTKHPKRPQANNPHPHADQGPSREVASDQAHGQGNPAQAGHQQPNTTADTSKDT